MRITRFGRTAALAATVLAAISLAAGLPLPARADTSTGLASANVLSGTDGGNVYQHICQGCHMANGRGAIGAGVIPSLAGNAKLQSPGYPIYVVMNGLGGMPPVGGGLTDVQVAAVVNYVRTHFGNAFTGVATPDDVKQARLPRSYYTPSE